MWVMYDVPTLRRYQYKYYKTPFNIYNILTFDSMCYEAWVGYWDPIQAMIKLITDYTIFWVSFCNLNFGFDCIRIM